MFLLFSVRGTPKDDDKPERECGYNVDNVDAGWRKNFESKNIRRVRSFYRLSNSETREFFSPPSRFTLIISRWRSIVDDASAKAPLFRLEATGAVNGDAYRK